MTVHWATYNLRNWGPRSNYGLPNSLPPSYQVSIWKQQQGCWHTVMTVGVWFWFGSTFFTRQLCPHPPPGRRMSKSGGICSVCDLRCSIPLCLHPPFLGGGWNPLERYPGVLATEFPAYSGWKAAASQDDHVAFCGNGTAEYREREIFSARPSVPMAEKKRDIEPAGHQDIKRTPEMVRQHCHRPGMSSEIRKLVPECDGC